MKHSLFVLPALVAFATLGQPATESSAHCQIPCGIYGDEARFTALLEDVTTVRKSVTKIIEEGGKEKPDYNQLVRWVMNKETHADNIKTAALEYFLAQRIKPDADQYVEKLKSLHQIIVHAMKVKQTTDPKIVDALEAEVKKFHKMYSGK